MKPHRDGGAVMAGPNAPSEGAGGEPGAALGESVIGAPGDDLRALLPDVEETAPVFFRSALVYFGSAGPHLVEAFDRLYLMVIESNDYDRSIPEGALFQTEAEALAADLEALAGHAAQLARQGPLDRDSSRQIRTCAALAAIARKLHELRETLEAAYA